LWLVIAMTLSVAACQDRKPDPVFLSGADGRAIGSTSDKRHFIEFRARYALSYGHSYVVYGRID
jgi:hypothetical protein